MISPALKSALMTVVALGAVSLALIACEDDPAVGEPGTSTTTPNMPVEGIDRESILGDLAEVQAILETSASSLPADAIEDVEYEDGTLRIVGNPDFANLEQAEALCEDMSAAIASADLSIEVVNAAGEVLASCTFE